jgi:hypothetical protein
MFFGGGSQRWVADAIGLLDANRDVLACYPLAGPPRRDGRLSRLTATWADGWLEGQTAAPSDLEHFAYSYPDISTRVFMLDRRRFVSGEFRIPLVRPKLRRVVKALLFHSSLSKAVEDYRFLLVALVCRGGYVYGKPRNGAGAHVSGWRRGVESLLDRVSPCLALEDCFSILALMRGARFIGFLGSEGGLWSLHPPYRSERFYTELPNLIRRVESDDIPDEQRGDFDINDAMLNWSDVRPAAPFGRFSARR